MWLYFNKKGQLITSLEHGSPARVGTTNFSIFAVFEGMDSSLGNIMATIKLYKPDLYGSSYPILLMTAKSETFTLDWEDGETPEKVYPFVQNGLYNGFLFDFADFNDAQTTEVLLDTSGLWEAVITLVSSEKNLNVQGIATFKVANGIVNQDGTNIDIDIVLSQIIGELAQKLSINRGIYTLENLSEIEDKLSEFDIGQLFFNKADNKLYKLAENTDVDPSQLELQLFFEPQEKLVSGQNVKTINNQDILGEGNITIQSGGPTYDLQGLLFSEEDCKNILESMYSFINWTISTSLDGSDISHGLQIEAGTYELRYSRLNNITGAKTYQLAIPSGQMAEFIFYKNENDNYVCDIVDLSNNSVAGTQATATVIIDALHNLNGRYMSRYGALDTTIGGYRAFQITRSDLPIDMNEAKIYMRAMTGSSFVPVYNQYRPQNSLFVMADGSFWKPQFDNVNGLCLYNIPNPYLLKSNEANSVYTTNGMIPFASNTAGGHTIVRRSTSGYIKSAPTTDSIDDDYVTTKGYVNNKIASAVTGVYKIAGARTVVQLNNLTKTTDLNGSVFNVTDAGQLTNSVGSRELAINVLPGDNVVFIWNNSRWFWDKMAAEFDTSNLMTTDTNQPVTGEKTFNSPTVFNAATYQSTSYITNIYVGTGNRIYSNDANKIIINNGSNYTYWDDSTIRTTCNITPYGSGYTCDLGARETPWQNLYLSGNISDGANQAAATEIISAVNNRLFKHRFVLSGGAYYLNFDCMLKSASPVTSADAFVAFADSIRNSVGYRGQSGTPTELIVISRITGGSTPVIFYYVNSATTEQSQNITTISDTIID